MSEPQRRVFELPDVGEGLAEARVEDFLVEVGDEVQSLDPVVEVETDKSMVELTSPWTGVVTQLLAEPDEWVEVGAPLLEIEVTPEP